VEQGVTAGWKRAVPGRLGDRATQVLRGPGSPLL